MKHADPIQTSAKLLTIIRDMLDISNEHFADTEIGIGVSAERVLREYRTIRVCLGRTFRDAALVAAVELITPNTIVVDAFYDSKQIKGTEPQDEVTPHGDKSVVAMYAEYLAQTNPKYRGSPTLGEYVAKHPLKDMNRLESRGSIALKDQFMTRDFVLGQRYGSNLTVQGYDRVIVLASNLLFRHLEEKVFYNWVQPLMRPFASTNEIILLD